MNSSIGNIGLSVNTLYLCSNRLSMLWGVPSVLHSKSSTDDSAPT